MLIPVRTSPPAAALLTLEEAKAHCRVDHSDDNTLIESLIAAVTAHLDGYHGIMGRALVNQSWRLNLRSWPTDGLRLPFSPVVSVTSVKYYDTLNAQQTFATSNYSLIEDAVSPYLEWIQNVSFPSVYSREDALEVVFVAGYGATADAVPAPIRAAALLMLGHLYEHRESFVTGETFSSNPAVGSLLEPFRRKN